jgi:hypothetical protein
MTRRTRIGQKRTTARPRRRILARAMRSEMMGGKMIRRRKILLHFSGIVVAIATWFLGIDWSWFEEDCPDCGYGRTIAQYRVFSYPVREQVVEHPTVLQRVASDLGVACDHANSRRWHKHRWWGLCYCSAPCNNGIDRLRDDDSWYNAAAVARLHEAMRSDADFTNRFREQVLIKHDRHAWRSIVEQIHPGNSLP